MKNELLPLKKVYIRFREGMPDGVNMMSAHEGFRKFGTEIAPFFGFGDLEHLAPGLGPEVGVFGYVGDVQAALLSSGRALIGPPLDYPPELKKYLGRKISQSTLGQVKASTEHVFVKPVTHKLFTGRVWTGSREDRLGLAPYIDTAPVWTSSLVTFRSEYRAFVLDGMVLDCRRYKGSWRSVPNFRHVEDMVDAYSSSPIAYALDVGTISGTSKPLLVEVNDAFALGCYGLRADLYARMISARWTEMWGEA